MVAVDAHRREIDDRPDGARGDGRAVAGQNRVAVLARRDGDEQRVRRGEMRRDRRVGVGRSEQQRGDPRTVPTIVAKPSAWLSR
jgi:hypothetical protein